MFLSEWRQFPLAPCLARKQTWWQLVSRYCWNRARPWHASELVSYLVGLKTYQHPDKQLTSPVHFIHVPDKCFMRRAETRTTFHPWFAVWCCISVRWKVSKILSVSKVKRVPVSKHHTMSVCVGGGIFFIILVPCLLQSVRRYLVTLVSIV